MNSTKNILKISAWFMMLSISLIGCLPTIFTGATGSAMEFAKDRSAGETITDARISAAIKASLIKENFKYVYSRIKVEVVKGVVFFTGSVEKNEHALLPVQIAWQQQGVVEVINEIKVDSNSSNFNLVQYTRDTLITSQIKSKMFIDRDIKFVNITVITIDDIVYLFGIARSEEELQKVADIAATTRSVKQVVSHVRMEASARKITPQNYQKGYLVDNDKGSGYTSNSSESSNNSVATYERDTDW